MAAATRICKVCGKEYEYCHTNKRENLFRWQDVACCPEHGAEYFALVLASRSNASKDYEDVVGDAIPVETKPAPKKSKKTVKPEDTETEIKG